MNDQDEFAARARELFEQAGHRLDPAAANRLRVSRRAALLAPPGRARRLLPLAASASLLALGLAWWFPRHPAAPASTSTSGSSDAAVLDSDEDDEIYTWLSDAPVAPDRDQGGAL